MGEFNGWPNYETWCVAHWIDGSQRRTRAVFRIVRDTYNPTAEYPILDAAEALHQWMTAQRVPPLRSIWADLLGAALDAVDWPAIARHHLEVEA